MYSQYAIYWRFGKFRKRDTYDYILVIAPKFQLKMPTNKQV